MNLVGPFLALRAFVPEMRKRGTGHIVTIGSAADHEALPGNAAYGASKHGLRAMHEVLTLELEGTNIRTTLVSPTPTDTSLWDTVDRRAHPDLPERSAMLKPVDVARMVVDTLV